MSEYKILKATEHSFADKKKEEEEKGGKNEEERERSKLTFRMLSILQAISSSETKHSVLKISFPFQNTGYARTQII